MNNIARVLATGIIWAALTVFGVAIMVTQTTLANGPLMFIVAALVIGAASGTTAVWNGADARKEAEKTKRRSRVERLMSDLDERDMDELRSRLMDDPNNNETVSLEELMQTGKQR